MERRTLSRWLLPFSLALNVFFATVIAMRPPHFGHPPGPPNPNHIVERIADVLPPADAAILRQVFAAHSADIERGHALMHVMPNRVRAILAAPQLDNAALGQVMADDRAARATMDEAIQAVVMETIPKLSDEGRARLSRWDPRPPDGPGGPPPRD